MSYSHDTPSRRRRSSTRSDLSPRSLEHPRTHSVEEVYIERHRRQDPYARSRSVAYYDDGMERGRSPAASPRRASAWGQDTTRSLSYAGERRPSAFYDDARASSVASSSRRGSTQPSRANALVRADSTARQSSVASSVTAADRTDGYSSGEEARKLKKKRNKELLAAALATATTVAAGNEIYKSAQATTERRRMVREGTMGAEEARRLKNRGLAKDLLSLGVVALSVSNTMSCWKDTKDAHEARRVAREEAEKAKEAHERRERREWAEERRRSVPAVVWNDAYVR